jgi:hypothetical protein
MTRPVEVGGQARVRVALGGVELGLCQIEGFGKIGSFETGISEVSAEDVGA